MNLAMMTEMTKNLSQHCKRWKSGLKKLQMNLHIWHNESNYRKGIKDGNNLELTHGINGIRNTAKNKIQEKVGGRKDYKIDCLAADFKDWEISW